MNPKTNLLTTSALVLAASAAVYAQQPSAAAPPKASAGLINDWLREQSPTHSAWDLGAQLRFRYETFDKGPSFEFPNRDLQRTGVDNNNSYLWFREKLHIGYAPCAWVSAFVEGRDSSSTGDDHSKNPGADEFDLHQAYLALGNAKEFPVTFKVGRQEFIYGEERLIGAGDWTNVGRVFDATKARLETKDFWVDVFSGRVVLTDNQNFNIANDYDWLSGVYASTRTLVPIQETQLYVLARNTAAGSPTANAGGKPDAGGAGPRDIYTTGVRVKSLPGKLGGWDYTAEVAVQRGSVNTGGGTPRRVEQEALAGSWGGGYTWKQAWASPRLGLEYNFSSGDKDPADNKSETFDNLFPTNHKHYGYMDFAGWRNIHNPRLSATIKPIKQLSVSLDYHWFWLADTHDFFYPQSGNGRGSSPTAANPALGYGRNAGFSSYAGSEIDLDVTCNLTPWSAVRAGYGHFFAGKYVEQSKSALGGATDANWAYLQLVLNF